MAVPLRLGLQINTTQRVFRWAKTHELANAAEACGFASLWTEDHLFYRSRAGELVRPWDPYTTLGGIAAVTERVRIGTLVTPLALPHPMLLARMAASLDEMSNGRFVLGLGAGHQNDEHAAVGVALDGRRA